MTKTIVALVMLGGSMAPGLSLIMSGKLPPVMNIVGLILAAATVTIFGNVASDLLAPKQP